MAPLHGTRHNGEKKEEEEEEDRRLRNSELAETKDADGDDLPKIDMDNLFDGFNELTWKINCWMDIFAN